jgi:hypothetical protein
MSSIIIDKQNFQELPNPNPEALTLGFDVDGLLKKRDSDGNVTAIGAELLINTDRATLLNDIGNNLLRVGAIYRFFADSSHKCYTEGVEVYMQALSSDFLSKVGYGEFYNPKYTSLTTDVTGGIWYASNEYSIGNTTIWGGYHWTNNSGDTGNYIDYLTLDSNWDKIEFNDTDYNVVYDIIEYDIQTDTIYSRKEVTNQNHVRSIDSYNGGVEIEGVTYDLNPIRYFKWGTAIESDPSISPLGIGGVVKCEIIDSLFFNLNDKSTITSDIRMNGSFQSPVSPGVLDWFAQTNITMEEGSYQIGLTFSHSLQSSISLQNGSHQSSLILDGGYQHAITLDNSYQTEVNIVSQAGFSGSDWIGSQENINISNGYQQNIYIENGKQFKINIQNSYQDTISIIGDGSLDSAIQSNISILNDSYQVVISIYGGAQSNISISNNSRQSIISLTYSSQYWIELDNSSYQENLLFDTSSHQFNLEFNNGSYQYSVIMDNSYQSNLQINNSSYQNYITITDLSYQNNISMDSGSQITNITLNSASHQRLLSLMMGSIINNCSLDVSSSQDRLTLSGDSAIDNINMINSSSQDHLNLSGASEISDIDFDGGYQRYMVLSNQGSIATGTITGCEQSHFNITNKTLSGFTLTSNSQFFDLSSYTRQIDSYEVETTEDTVSTDPYSISLNVSNFFILTLNSNTTFTFDNFPNSGLGGTTAIGFILKLVQSSYSVTWPTIQWSNGTPPTLSGATDIFVFVSTDGGSTWFGNMALTNIS